MKCIVLSRFFLFLGLAKVIDPIHTRFDGDACYAVSVGDVECSDSDFVGNMAASLVGTAVRNAIAATGPEISIPPTTEE